MKRATDEFMGMLRQMLDLTFATGHRTVWHDGDDGSHLIYFTFAPDQAKKAIWALRNANCLCHTNLGQTGSVVATEDVPETDRGVAQDVLNSHMAEFARSGGYGAPMPSGAMSHGALLDAIELPARRTAERDASRAEVKRLRSDRDAAIARAEKAEADLLIYETDFGSVCEGRDEWRERAEKAERAAVKLLDLFTSCYVCGASFDPGPMPYCEDACDADGDGECIPRDEWRCEVELVSAEVEAMRASVKL